MSSFGATAVIFHCGNTFQTEEVWAAEITWRSMAVFTSPTAFKKDLKYLVKISLENNTLVLLVKSLAIKKGVETLY